MGLSKSTLRSYARLWKVWVDYCEVRKDSGLPGDPFLTDVDTEPEKTKVYAKYIWYLRVAVGIVPTALDTYLAAMKKELGVQGISVQFADDRSVLVKNAKKAAKKMTRTELREQLFRRDARLKIPFFDPLSDWIYVQFWENTQWDWDGTALKMICCAILLMDLFGFRESNVVRPRKGNDDHTLRAEDIMFRYRTIEGQVAKAIGGSEEFLSITPEQVISVHLIVVSSKRSIEAVRKMVTPADVRGVRLIRVLLQWLQHSRVGPEDMLCTCHRQSEVNANWYSYTLTSSRLSWGIKAAAVANGYPPEHFASSSLRKGMATRGGLEGEDEEVTAERGGWKSKDVMRKHYNHAPRLYRERGDNAPLRDCEVMALLAR